jgi:hypothetical protein
MKKWLEYLVSEVFSNRKCHGLDPWLGDQRRAWSMVAGHLGRLWSSPELGLAAAPSHSCLP